MSSLRGVVAALLVTAVGLGWQFASCREDVLRYDRHVLPAFDAYVYTAMAERPAFFTVAPWGFRVLAPWLVWQSPARDAARGFLAQTLACLLVGGPLIFLLLRRLGGASGPALLAVTAYSLSQPVGEALRYTFLSDPLCLVLWLVLLLALESGAGALTLAAIFGLGTLTKELFLLLVPGVWLAARDRVGDRRALARTAAAALAVGAVNLGLGRWVPHIASGAALPDPETFWLAVYRILEGVEGWWAAALLYGLTPLAVVGALRPAARPFLWRHAYFIVLTLGLPFAAAVYTDSRLVPFFPSDVPRLLLFALPLLLALALFALGQVSPEPGAGRVRSWRYRAEPVAAAAALAFALALPWAALDPYRRLDLRGPRDGRLLLAFCRQSLAFAERLERGRLVDYEPESRRFEPQRSEPRLLERMRWFLRDGWGPMPHYGMGAVVMQAGQASIVLPCLRPADLDLTLELSAPAPTPVSLRVNGRGWTAAQVDAERTPVRGRLPAALLFRGDNLLQLSAPLAGVRLLGLKLQLAAGPVAGSG